MCDRRGAYAAADWIAARWLNIMIAALTPIT
jgi:hypothetical protein